MPCPSLLWFATASDRTTGWGPGVVSINDCRYINSVKERNFGGYFQPLSLLQLSSSLKPMLEYNYTFQHSIQTVFPYPRVVYEFITTILQSSCHSAVLIAIHVIMAYILPTLLNIAFPLVKLTRHDCFHISRISAE